MTSQETWRVSKRVLGTYFLVQGFLYFAGALMMVGIVIPEGSSRAGYVSASLLQGAIALVAGAILLRGHLEGPGSTSTPIERRAVTHVALQLLGVFFLVQGAVALANPSVSIFLVRADWSFRASEFVAAGVELLAGSLLISRPAQFVAVLSRYDGA